MIIEELSRLPPGHRVAFCAAVAERLLPNYAAFAVAEGWGDPDALRAILDFVWDFAAGTAPPGADLATLAARCDAATPEPGEFRSDLASAALDAATTIAAALACCGDADPRRCGEAATYARDTVDMYLQIQGTIDSDDPNLEANIQNHPLMIREIERQRLTVHLLREAVDIDSQLIDRLKALARPLSTSFTWEA